MNNLIIVTDDLFKSSEQYICHQCNAMSAVSAHLAQQMFARFPYADIYSHRERNKVPYEDEMPGNIIIKGNGKDQRFVINMIGQMYPGKPRFPDSNKDGYEARESYFRSCLDHINNIDNLNSVAFPWQIGCGAAGGDWNIYLKMIKIFANANPNTQVVIYKLE